MLTIGLDAALAASAGGAMLYCAVLSRRLSRLHRLKEGVGLALTELSSSAARCRAESEGVGAAAAEAVGTLNEAFAEVEAKRREVLDLADVLDGQGAALERRAKKTRAAAEESLSVAAARARIELTALSETVGIAHETCKALGGTPPRPEPTVPPEAAGGEEQAPPRPLRHLAGTRAVQRPAGRPNPFLRVAS